jgi:hypothetical protein
MKKLFLLFAASALVISAVAQKPAVNPTPVRVKQVVKRAILDVNQVALPFSQKPLGANSKAVTPVFVGASSNTNGVLVPQENQVCYNAELNVISYGHRSGPTNANTLGSDIINAISTDAGSTWDSTNVVYSNTSFPGRYPTAALYNPTGNTDVANLYSICAGPAINGATFGATYIGWKKQSGVAKNYVINHGNADRFDREFFQICQDGRFYFSGLAHTDDGTNYTKLDFHCVSGKLNSVTDTIENLTTTPIVPPFAKLGTDTIGWGNGRAAVAFNKAGTVGYYVFMGVRGDVADPMANLSKRPIIYKTTDQGTTWNIQPDFDFKNVDAFSILPSVWQDTTIVLPLFGDIDDVIVDGNDNLHILSYVQGRSSNLVDIDSANYIFGFSSIEGIMFDTYTTAGGGWNATAIDYVYGKTLDAAATGEILIENRLQTGVSEDGMKIFYAWEDTDPANGTDNVLPDAYVNGRLISDTLINLATKVCLTTGTNFENGAYMLCLAPEVKEVSGMFYPHIVLTQFGAVQDNDPVKYYYLKGAQLQLTVSINDIDNNIANVSDLYPNPTNGLTNVDLSLVKNANVSIQVVNMMGQVVSSQDCGQKTAGMHKLTINATDLTSGIYFVTVKAGNSTSTSKMIVR